MAELASSCLTLLQVQNELKEVVGAEWYLLGFQLGIETTHLKIIEAKYHDPERCKIEVLEFWLSNAPDPSWETLLVALEAMGTHTRLVCMLQEKYLQLNHVIMNGATPAEVAGIKPVSQSNGSYCSSYNTEPNLYTELQDEPPVAGCSGSDYDESDLEVETDKIMLNFGALVTRVQIALKQLGVTVDELASHLETVKALEPVYALSKTPLLLDCIEEVRSQNSIGDAFRCFSDYFSWFNYLLIENIINTFCQDIKDVQERLGQFIGQFQEYCKNRLCKCPKNGFGLGRKKDASTLVIKVDHKWDVARVKQVSYIRDTIARVLNIKKQALYLRTVKNGCIELTFLVPTFVADAMTSIFNPEEIGAVLSSIGVLELHCKEFDYYQYEDDSEGDSVTESNDNSEADNLGGGHPNIALDSRITETDHEEDNPTTGCLATMMNFFGFRRVAIPNPSPSPTTATPPPIETRRIIPRTSRIEFQTQSHMPYREPLLDSEMDSDSTVITPKPPTTPLLEVKEIVPRIEDKDIQSQEPPLLNYKSSGITSNPPPTAKTQIRKRWHYHEFGEPLKSILDYEDTML